MISFKHSGDLSKTDSFLKAARTNTYVHILEKYGREGVVALASATPLNSGQTAKSWGYQISRSSKGIKLSWTNSNIVDGVKIAVIIQYGHATQNGGYVQGQDYINPALRPIFNKMANEIWREVMKS